MNIRETFLHLRQKGEMALIPYLTAGYPTLVDSMAHVRLMAEHGADIIEIGVPFSDPIADGPTIQYSSQVALRQGVTVHDILSALHRIDVPLPIVLMSYLNPLLAYGRERLLGDMREAGVCGLIVPDLPLEEAQEWVEGSKANGISLVGMVAPTSTDERIEAIARHCDAFIYCVSVTGITGVRRDLHPGLEQLLTKVKSITDTPVAVGFGISNPEQIRALRGKADGVVVGSRLIEAVRNGESLADLIENLKDATRSKS